jgi:hypothetical protein
MNVKVLIIILNCIAGLSLLMYPLILMAGIMGFDAPGSERSGVMQLIFLAILVSPILIVVSIVLSWMRQSMVWAIIGCIPVAICLVFLGSELLRSSKFYKHEFDTVRRDFVCSNNAFIHIDDPSEKSVTTAYLYSKKGYKYTKTGVATVYDQEYVYILPSDKVVDTVDQDISSCKNNDNNGLTDVYKEITDEALSDFLKRSHNTIEHSQ